MESFRSLFPRYMGYLRLDVARVFLCMLASLSLPAAHAQMLTLTNSTAAPIPGAGHDYIHLLNETVNPANGSVTVNINFPMPQGRGLALPFSINYNSGQVIFSEPAIVWTQYLDNQNQVLRNAEGLIWSNNSDLIASGGWVYGLPFTNWINGKMSAQGNYTDPNGNTQYCPNTTGYVFRDTSGESHELYLGAAGSASTPTGTLPCTTYATQGGDDFVAASITYQPTSVTALSTPLTVSDLATGTTYKFAGALMTSGATYGLTGGLLPYLVEDHNGNQINVTQSNGGTPTTGPSLFTFNFIDTLKRTVLSDTGFTGSPETLTAGGQSYTIKWRTTSANYSVPYSANLATVGGNCGGIPPIQITSNSHLDTLTVISSITLPNGQAYHFYYGDDNPHGLGNSYGLLSEIDYPDGGSVQYTWKLSDQYSDLMDYPAGNTAFAPIGTGTNFSALIPDGCLYRYEAPVVATRTVFYAGTTPAESQIFTYATAWSSNNPGWNSKTTSVTTNDITTGKGALKKYNYLPISQGLPPYAQSHLPPEIPVEQSVATYDWGNTSTPTVIETKAWYDQYEMACDFTTLNGTVSSGHFYQYGLGAQVSDDKEYDFGQVSSPASVCTGSGTNSSLNAVPAAPSNPIRETATTFQRFTNPLGTIFASPQAVITYGSNGTKAAETDFGYDGGSLGSASAVQHDESSFPASVVTGRGNVTLITRQCLGCTNAAKSYAYDETGHAISSMDACGIASCSDVTGTNHTTTYSYADSPSNGASATNAYLTQINDPLGHVQKLTYNYVTGQLASATDANNNTTNYTYADSLNRLTQTQGPPDPNNNNQRPTTSYTYNDSPATGSAPQSPSVTTAELLNTAGASKTTTVILDGMGHPVQTQFNSDPAGVDLVDTTYTGMGAVQSVTNPYRSASDPTYGKTTYTYDAFGRKLLQNNPDGSTASWCYNGVATGGQSNCSSNASSATHSSWIDFTDEAGRHTQRESDSFGRLTAVMEPNPSSGALAAETDYTYDTLNDLTLVYQKGISGETPHQRNFAYDSLGRLLTSSNPETGTICYGTMSGDTCTSGYDANGNLVAKTDARGVQISYTYDALNRLLSKTGPNLNEGFAYDTANVGTGGAFHAQNPIGRLVESASPPQLTSKQFSYDSIGRVILEANTLPSICCGIASQTANEVSAVYDLAGNLTDLTYPDLHHIHQTWNSAGQLGQPGQVAIQDTVSGTPYVNAVSYNPDGSPYVMTLGNGVQQTITRNNRLQVQSLSVSGPPPFNSQPFLTHTYCYVNCATGGTANNGNIWGITDNLSGSRTQGFTYDNLNRISSFTLNGTSNQQYSIDSFGNMSPLVATSTQQPIRSCKAPSLCAPVITFSYVPSLTFDPATNRTNNLPCARSVAAYDAAGNQLCDSDPFGLVRQYAYDAEERVSQIAVIGQTASPFETYVYGADGARVRKTGNAGNFTEYVDFNGQPIAEKDQSGAWTDYIYANGTKIATVARTDHRIHLSGTVVKQGWEMQASIPIPANFVFKTGDTLCWQQYNSNAVGGLAIGENNGWTAWQLSADDGQQANQDFNSGGWQNRCANLNGIAGLTMNAVLLVKDDYCPLGKWDMLIADLVIDRADGTVVQLFTSGMNPALSLQGLNTQYDTAFNAVVEDVSPGSDPIVPASSAQNRLTHFNLGDHLGTAQMEFSSGGWPTWQGQFAPFGGEIDTQTTSNHYKFTGKERDAESGLDYFGARYYGSSMGRFQSPDSLLGSPENPQSWNLYSYVQNNPVTNTDPDGHDCVVQTRTSSTTESVSVSAGNCDHVSVGDGQSKSYIAGTVDTSSITANSQGGISLGYTPYAGGANLGVASLSAASIPDNPGLAYGYGNNAQGYQQLSNASQVVKAGTVAYAGVYGGVACYFACPAGAAAAGRWGLQRLALGASSPALLNLINRLYQAQDELPGGTAGAVRNEVATGEYINGGHAMKAQEMISAITKLINSGELSGGDQTIAGHLISDLKSSLGK